MSTTQQNMEWRKKVVQRYQSKLDNPNHKGPFDTWEDFYNYIREMMRARVLVHRLERLPKYRNETEPFELLFDQGINPYKTPNNVERGDLFVDPKLTGYRSQGMGIFDVIDGEIIFKQLADEPDDYGTIPSEFRVISDFPVLYWHGGNINMEGAYWHVDYVWFNPKDINLQFTPEMVKDVPKDSESYITFSFNNIMYAIVGSTSAFKEHLNVFNGLQAYHCIGDIDWVGDTTNDILRNLGITKGQILYIPDWNWDY